MERTGFGSRAFCKYLLLALSVLSRRLRSGGPFVETQVTSVSAFSQSYQGDLDEPYFRDPRFYSAFA